jgi:hypothetical protein
MYSQLALSDAFVRDRVDELLREAANDRMAQLVVRPNRPVRARVAEWLVVLAERIDSRPQGSIARAEA